MDKKIKNNQGVTLIALVLTIIVLAILAGVTVFNVTGGNGIIGNALKAKSMAEVKDEKELIELSMVEAIENNKYGDLKLDELQKLLVKNFKDRKVGIYTDTQNYLVVLDEGKRFYTVSFEGKIISYTDVNLNDYDVQKLATGIYGAKAEDGTVTIINTALNKISQAKLWSGEIAEDFASGDGSKQNPYTIETAEQLAYFAKFTNDGNTTKDKYFELKNDIVLNWNVLDDDFNLNSGTFNIWIPIGYNDVESNSYRFKGVFNGNNHIVSGVYFQRTGNNYKGFFGHVGELKYSNCFVKSIGVIDSYMRGYDLGGIIGSNFQGNILNCYYSGNLSGAYHYGGIYAHTRDTTNLSSFFVEGTCKKISDYGSPQNAYISSSSYTLPDFIKDYMQ